MINGIRMYDDTIGNSQYYRDYYLKYGDFALEADDSHCFLCLGHFFPRVRTMVGVKRSA